MRFSFARGSRNMVAGMDDQSKEGRAIGRGAMVAWAAMIVITLLGAYLGFAELGARSLWVDEFSTWRVSRMPIGESLRWAPEITIAPLYQFCLRVLSGEPRPAEWVLRLPAGLCGALLIPAGFFLGRRCGGADTGCALGALLACNVFQLQYSREARPYSMLVVDCTLSTWLWLRLTARGGFANACAYVAAATFALYAHYLAVLAIAAQAIWRFAATPGRGTGHTLRSLVAPGVVGVLGIPLLIRTLRFGGAVPDALSWIEPPSWRQAWAILQQLTFGPVWVLGFLLPALAVWALAAGGVRMPGLRQGGGEVFTGRGDVVALLLTWLVCAWLGLLVISWLVRPLLVARYAIPASVPALLIPLLIAHRLDHRLPAAIGGLFLLGTGPAWIMRPVPPDPGFRELAAHVNSIGDPRSDAVLLAIAGTPDQGAELERLWFQYYRLESLPLGEWRINDAASTDAALRDPRRLFVVVFRGDPLPLIRAFGRTIEPYLIEDRNYDQATYEPYRLIRLAPLSTAGDSSSRRGGP